MSFRDSRAEDAGSSSAGTSLPVSATAIVASAGVSLAVMCTMVMRAPAGGVHAAALAMRSATIWRTWSGSGFNRRGGVGVE